MNVRSACFCWDSVTSAAPWQLDYFPFFFLPSALFNPSLLFSAAFHWGPSCQHSATVTFIPAPSCEAVLRGASHTLQTREAECLEGHQQRTANMSYLLPYNTPACQSELKTKHNQPTKQKEKSPNVQILSHVSLAVAAVTFPSCHRSPVTNCFGTQLARNCSPHPGAAAGGGTMFGMWTAVAKYSAWM